MKQLLGNNHHIIGMCSYSWLQYPKVAAIADSDHVRVTPAEIGDRPFYY